MRLTPECSVCLLSRIRYECERGSENTAAIKRAEDECSALLKEIKKEEVASPVIASRIHRHAYSTIGCQDPYALQKESDTKVAKHALKLIQDELHSFRDFCTAAAIGNTLDYGSLEHIVTDNFKEHLIREFQKGLSIDHTDQISPLCKRVVYFCDNCGEIVFDRLLISYLKKTGAHVTVVVRGAPILNDATMDNAMEIGIDRIADALLPSTAGIAELGYNPEFAPPLLKEALLRATIVISKGMANYESFTEYPPPCPVAFLMSVKCTPIARSVGAKRGAVIALLKEREELEKELIWIHEIV